MNSCHNPICLGAAARWLLSSVGICEFSWYCYGVAVLLSAVLVAMVYGIYRARGLLSKGTSVKLPVWALIVVPLVLIGFGYWWKEHAKDNIYREENTIPGVWVDEKNRSMWTLRPSDTRMNWREAVNYCNGLTLADFKDWQLPTKEKLGQIWDEKAKHVRGIKGAALLWSGTSIGKDGNPGTDYAAVFDSGNWGYGIIEAQTKASAVCVRPLD